MPHFQIEYSSGLIDRRAISDALHGLHALGAASGIMSAADIKVRAIGCEDFLVGGEVVPFCHLTVSMLEGRTDAQKLMLSQALLAQLISSFPSVARLSVDIHDMNDACYKKRPYEGLPA